MLEASLLPEEEPAPMVLLLPVEPEPVMPEPVVLEPEEPEAPMELPLLEPVEPEEPVEPVEPEAPIDEVDGDVVDDEPLEAVSLLLGVDDEEPVVEPLVPDAPIVLLGVELLPARPAGAPLALPVAEAGLAPVAPVEAAPVLAVVSLRPPPPEPEPALWATAMPLMARVAAAARAVRVFLVALMSTP